MNAPVRLKTLPWMLTIALATGLSLQCRGAEPEADGRAPSSSASSEESDHDSLRNEAVALVEFLRGSATLDPNLLADSVVFWLAAEGGGDVRVVTRNVLQARSEWRVGDHNLVPPSSLTELTIRPGSHFNCLEMSLASRFPELGGLPHVGVRLAPPDFASCLQTWNATLVFRKGPAEQPKLIGVAYDQWEW